MSTYSNHHQFRASLADVVDAATGFLWSQRLTLDVECLALADAAAHIEQLDALPDEQFWRGWVLAAEGGWTSLWGTWGGSDEALVRDVAGTLGCDALYGHHNDQVDNWRWIRFFAGAPRDEYWYTGQAWFRFGHLEPEAMTHWEAFTSMGRDYAHLSFHGALHADRPPSAGARVLTWVYS